HFFPRNTVCIFDVSETARTRGMQPNLMAVQSLSNLLHEEIFLRGYEFSDCGIGTLYELHLRSHSTVGNQTSAEVHRTLGQSESSVVGALAQDKTAMKTRLVAHRKSLGGDMLCRIRA
ncbi:hypothetical protein, partial [Ruegeria arenilitoris]|uniref:hypothetical protein n=1 Tax=Ruegeria arenilitoris TaxID=1173585 RepID=UPI001C2BE069